MMQRKALKQLNKVTQWTNEKVFSGERTQFSDEFAEFEGEIEPLRIGVERLHATSIPFHDQLVKAKPTADPYPPGGASKDKVPVGEALGLVMIDYGHDAGGSFGDGLVKYGQARCKLATIQQEFGERMHDTYIESTETALAAVKDYVAFRKKMDSRRLTLDSALNRLRSTKKESYTLEQEVEMAQQRFDEAEEDTKLRMVAIKQQQAEQFVALTELLHAELEFFTQCKDILEGLQEVFPTSHTPAPSRPRARSNPPPPARSPSRGQTRMERTPSRNQTRTPSRREARTTDSDEEATPSGRPRSGSRAERKERAEEREKEGRERSDSGASASRAKGRGLMSSIGSIGTFGKSGFAAASAASKSATRTAKSFGKGRGDARAVNLESDDEDGRHTPPPRPSASRARSHSVIDVVTGLGVPETSGRRRALTSPSSPAARFVKVLYAFEGAEPDELPLHVGQVIEVKSEVSDDWLLGEYEGQSGIFPRAYTEEHIPTPTSATVPVPVRTRSDGPQRRLPPSFGQPPSPLPDYSESETDALDSDEENASTSLATAAQPPPTSRSRSGSAARKPAPPPPPSRRGTATSMTFMSPSGQSPSSSAILATSPRGGSGFGTGAHSPVRLPPPAPVSRSRSSTLTRRRSDEDAQSPFAGGSPFAHSDDDESPAKAAPRTSIAHALAGMHLRRSPPPGTGNGVAADCGACGCDEFKQNPFKPRGMCASCFHQH